MAMQALMGPYSAQQAVYYTTAGQQPLATRADDCLLGKAALGFCRRDTPESAILRREPSKEEQ